MTLSPLRVLAVATPAPVEGCVVEQVEGWPDALHRLGSAVAFDVVLIDGDAHPASTDPVPSLTGQAVLVVVLGDPDVEQGLDWLRHGAEDVIGRSELAGPTALRRLRFAVERRRRRGLDASAFSTDPTTGLPHRQQLVEHLSQLLALREREPAPMAVLAFRIEGLRPRGERAEATEVDALRRKIAVRLRAGVRVSDVVATVDDDAFAVLLGSILTSADADRVAAKILASLLAPFIVGAIARSVAVALGVAHYPLDGREADRLLRRALALAAAAPAAFREGPITSVDAGGDGRAAANDER